MRNEIIIIIFLVFFSCTYEGPDRSISFDMKILNSEYISTEKLLDEIKWEEIRLNRAETMNYTYKNPVDSFLTTYTCELKQENEAYEIISYNGLVLEYNKSIYRENVEYENEYFNKVLWMDYVNEVLVDLPDEYKIGIDESKQILKSYYHLIGLNTSDEYGWICEYSTVGMMTDKRKAVLEIVEEERVDLLKNLIDFPNSQVRIYAIDALIYLDYKITKEIDYIKKALREEVPDITEAEIEQSPMIVKRESKLLNKAEIEQIGLFRNSNKEIATCGNMGSYKIYGSTTEELLSDEKIAEIIKNYEDHEILKKL